VKRPIVDELDAMKAALSGIGIEIAANSPESAPAWLSPPGAVNSISVSDELVHPELPGEVQVS